MNLHGTLARRCTPDVARLAEKGGRDSGRGARLLAHELVQHRSRTRRPWCRSASPPRHGRREGSPTRATVLRPLSYHHATSPSTPSHHVCPLVSASHPTRPRQISLLDWDAPTPAGQPTCRVCTPRHCCTTNLRRSCGGWTRGRCCVHRHSLWSRVWPPPLRGGEAHPHTAGCGGTLPVRVEGRGDGQRAACSLPLGFSGGDGPHASAAAACDDGGGHG